MTCAHLINMLQAHFRWGFLEGFQCKLTQHIIHFRAYHFLFKEIFAAALKYSLFHLYNKEVFNATELHTPEGSVIRLTSCGPFSWTISETMSMMTSNWAALTMWVLANSWVASRTQSMLPSKTTSSSISSAKLFTYCGSWLWIQEN